MQVYKRNPVVLRFWSWIHNQNREAIIFVVFLLVAQFSFGQTNRLSVQASSGFFSFGGESASRKSSINISDVASIPNYTNSPYGTRSGFSYGIGIHVQKITSRNFIYGLQMSFESLESKLTIDNAYGEINWTVEHGEATLTSRFINLFPSIGQRVNLLKNVDSDFLLGSDLGIGLSSKERYSVGTGQGSNVSGTYEREIPGIDFRPRIEFVNYYKSIGFTVGYSYGLTNYLRNMDGANRDARSRYLRLGISYRL